MVALSKDRPRHTSQAPQAPQTLKVLWLVLVASYFVIPLLATAVFSLQGPHGQYSLAAFTEELSKAAFLRSFLLSLRLAGETIVVSIVLMVPTAYWVHLRLRRARPLVEMISFLPFVVSPVVLAVGVENVFRKGPSWFVGSPNVLVAVYVVLSFPFLYRAVDAGLRSVDIRTLTEASQSLGVSGPGTLGRVILPNLASAILAGSLLTFAIVMGEFTISSLLLFNTFGVYIDYVGTNQATGAAALSLISFVLTWIAMGGIALALQRRGAGRQFMIGGR